ncbi:MAG: hypothetical protein WAL22_17945 [Solirubrobacteraceae bacterium]
MDPGRTRERWVTATVVVSVVLAIVALALSYAGRALLRPEPFADRAVAALRQPAVSEEVADRLADAVVGAGSGDLATVRPLIRAATGSIVSGPAFLALLRRAVFQAHVAVVRRDDHTMAVNVADAGVLVAGLLRRFAPAAARTVNAERAERLLTLEPGEGVLSAVRSARRVYTLAWVLAVIALLLAVCAIWRSRARRRIVRRLGAGLALGGLVLVALYTIGGAVAAQLAPSGRGAVVAALWQAFLGGLRVQALWTTAAGAVVAALAAQPLGPGQVAEIPWQGWRRLTGRDGGGVTRTGLAAAIALIAAGIAILLEPGAVLRVVVLAAGAFLLYRGVEGVLRWGVARYAAAVAAGRRSLGRARPALRFVPIVLGVAALAAVATVIVTGGGDEAPAATPTACNGFTALCGRPLNDVTFAATHNSMASVTIPTFLFGQQDGTIADQLDFGIRGLLIDTYYGDKVDGGVRTDLESLPKRAAAERELGAPAVNAALRLRSRLERRGKGRRGIYLCHGFCEIGAVSLSSALTNLRSFLISNPGAVVVVINQDEGVSPANIRRAFKQAGLLDLVYRGPLGPFPTLREMIDSNQRLVVMAENDAGDIPWYHLAYRDALQETPYRFRTTAALTDPSQVADSCRPNRGPSSAPLFLLNNWVDTTPIPRASHAAVVNARPALLTRSRTCQRIRHRLPNLVAVDFFRRGDVLGVVDALNRVGG